MKNILFIFISFSFFIILFANDKMKDAEYKRIISEIENIKKEISLAKPDDQNIANNYMKLGHLYSQINEIDKAQEAFENVIKINPKNDKAYFMLGLIYEKKKMFAQAINAWQKCLDYTQNLEVKKIAQKHLDYLKK